MPHLRKRHLEPILKKLLAYSPLVGILGHRQVGKTTLAEILGKEYYSLDLRTTQDMVSEDPLGFLNATKKHPAILDECQSVPDLFPALKEYVRNHPRPGAFILTGSVRFTSRKAIRESLTGRIIHQELLPMDLSEIHGQPLAESIVRLSKNLAHSRKLSPSKIRGAIVSEYLQKGGLPGIFSIRDRTLREQKISTQLETILDRDLRFLMETRLPFTTLRNVVAYLSRHQGETLKLSDMIRSTRVTRPTLLKLLLALEGLFLIRSVPTEGRPSGKVYFMEDQGEASWLIGQRTDPIFDLTRFLYANLRIQVHYRPELRTTLFRYETRGGAFIPLCFRIDGRELGILPIEEQNPNRSVLASATSFLKTYPKGKVVFCNERGPVQHLSARLCVIPAPLLVFG